MNVLRSFALGVGGGLYFRACRSLGPHIGDGYIGEGMRATAVAAPAVVVSLLVLPTRITNFTFQERCASAKNGFLQTAACCAGVVSAVLITHINPDEIVTFVWDDVHTKIAKLSAEVVAPCLFSTVPAIFGAVVGFIGNRSAAPGPPVPPVSMMETA